MPKLMTIQKHLPENILPVPVWAWNLLVYCRYKKVGNFIWESRKTRLLEETEWNQVEKGVGRAQRLRLIAVPRDLCKLHTSVETEHAMKLPKHLDFQKSMYWRPKQGKHSSIASARLLILASWDRWRNELSSERSLVLLFLGRHASNWEQIDNSLKWGGLIPFPAFIKYLEMVQCVLAKREGGRSENSDSVTL